MHIILSRKNLEVIQECLIEAIVNYDDCEQEDERNRCLKALNKLQTQFPRYMNYWEYYGPKQGGGYK